MTGVDVCSERLGGLAFCGGRIGGGDLRWTYLIVAVLPCLAISMASHGLAMGEDVLGPGDFSLSSGGTSEPEPTSSDTSTTDTSTTDTSTADTSTADTSTADTSTTDTSTTDTSTTDTSTTDTSTVDTSTVDTSTVDTGTVDTSTVDTSTVDTSTVDTSTTSTSTTSTSTSTTFQFNDFEGGSGDGLYEVTLNFSSYLASLEAESTTTDSTTFVSTEETPVTETVEETVPDDGNTTSGDTTTSDGTPSTDDPNLVLDVDTLDFDSDPDLSTSDETSADLSLTFTDEGSAEVPDDSTSTQGDLLLVECEGDCLEGSQSVPEPGAFGLVGLGLAGLVMLRRRRRT